MSVDPTAVLLIEVIPFTFALLRKYPARWANNEVEVNGTGPSAQDQGRARDTMIVAAAGTRRRMTVTLDTTHRGIGFALSFV